MGKGASKIQVNNLNSCNQEDLEILHNNTQEFIQNQQEIMVYTIVFSIIGVLLIFFASKYIADYRKKMKANQKMLEKLMLKLGIEQA